jgi:hypothetical protein
MVRSLARVTLALLGVGLVLLALAGVTVASQNPATLGVMAAFGAGAGLFVGASASWSRERDVGAGDAARFAGVGLVTVFGLTGAGVLEGVLSPLAVLAMLLGAWLLHGYLRDESGGYLRDEAGGVLGPNEPVGPSRRLPTVPRRCDSLPVSRLHELWEVLRSDDAPSRAPDPHLVELRSRVLDALARCDPEGYETWLRTDAPLNVAAHVGRHRPENGDTARR